MYDVNDVIVTIVLQQSDVHVYTLMCFSISTAQLFLTFCIHVCLENYFQRLAPCHILCSISVTLHNQMVCCRIWLCHAWCSTYV